MQPAGNRLINPGFEETTGGVKSRPKREETHNGWTYVFGGKTNGYAWQEGKSGTASSPGQPEFHAGNGALRISADGDGHVTTRQDIEVKPNMAYTASVWVRTVDLNGRGFGHDASDSAGLLLIEMNYFNKSLMVHPKVEMKKAGAYTLLSQKITTGPETTKVRFCLDAIIKCPRAEGYVTFDDCSFREAEAVVSAAGAEPR